MVMRRYPSTTIEIHVRQCKEIIQATNSEKFDREIEPRRSPIQPTEAETSPEEKKFREEADKRKKMFDNFNAFKFRSSEKTDNQAVDETICSSLG